MESRAIADMFRPASTPRKPATPSTPAASPATPAASPTTPAASPSPPSPPGDATEAEKTDVQTVPRRDVGEGDDDGVGGRAGVDEGEDTPGDGMEIYLEIGEDDFVAEDVFLAKEMVGHVIGKNGKTIKGLLARSGGGVVVDTLPNDDQEEMGGFKVKGPRRCVRLFTESVERLLEGRAKSGGQGHEADDRGNGSGRGQEADERGNSDGRGQDAEVREEEGYCEMWLSPKCVGWLIGKRGATIRRLCAETGTYIAVVDYLTGGVVRPEDGRKLVTVTGLRPRVPGGIDAVLSVEPTAFYGDISVRALPVMGMGMMMPPPQQPQNQQLQNQKPQSQHPQNQLQNGAFNQGLGLRSAPPPVSAGAWGDGNNRSPKRARYGNAGSDFDDASEIRTKCIYIPVDLIGKVIGKKGCTIKMLEEQSGAVVKVAPDESHSSADEERLITISGSTASINKASDLLDDHLKFSPSQEHVFVPRDFVLVLLGSNGRLIRDLQAKSAAHIHIDKNNDDARGDVRISFRGSLVAMRSARALVDDHLASKLGPGYRCFDPSDTGRARYGSGPTAWEAESGHIRGDVSSPPDYYDPRGVGNGHHHEQRPGAGPSGFYRNTDDGEVEEFGRVGRGYISSPAANSSARSQDARPEIPKPDHAVPAVEGGGSAVDREPLSHSPDDLDARDTLDGPRSRRAHKSQSVIPRHDRATSPVHDAIQCIDQDPKSVAGRRPEEPEPSASREGRGTPSSSESILKSALIPRAEPVLPADEQTRARTEAESSPEDAEMCSGSQTDNRKSTCSKSADGPKRVSEESAAPLAGGDEQCSGSQLDKSKSTCSGSADGPKRASAESAASPDVAGQFSVHQLDKSKPSCSGSVGEGTQAIVESAASPDGADQRSAQQPDMYEPSYPGPADDRNQASAEPAASPDVSEQCSVRQPDKSEPSGPEPADGVKQASEESAAPPGLADLFSGPQPDIGKPSCSGSDDELKRACAKSTVSPDDDDEPCSASQPDTSKPACSGSAFLAQLSLHLPTASPVTQPTAPCAAAPGHPHPHPHHLYPQPAAPPVAVCPSPQPHGHPYPYGFPPAPYGYPHTPYGHPGYGYPPPLHALSHAPPSAAPSTTPGPPLASAAAYTQSTPAMKDSLDASKGARAQLTAGPHVSTVVPPASGYPHYPPPSYHFSPPSGYPGYPPFPPYYGGGYSGYPAPWPYQPTAHAQPGAGLPAAQVPVAQVLPAQINTPKPAEKQPDCRPSPVTPPATEVSEQLDAGADVENASSLPTAARSYHTLQQPVASPNVFNYPPPCHPAYHAPCAYHGYAPPYPGYPPYQPLVPQVPLAVAATPTQPVVPAVSDVPGISTATAVAGAIVSST